jgi:hypothetical protein
MSAVTSKRRDGKTVDLLAEHRKLVAEYDVKVGAPKAATATKIGRIELELEIQGIEYPPFEPVKSYSQSWVYSETELVERMVSVHALATNPDKRDAIRHRAETELAKLVQQAERRKIAVPKSVTDQSVTDDSVTADA